MAIKDTLYREFLIRVLIPRMEIIDNPGFVVCQFTEKGKQTFLRELVLPENLFVELEKRVVEKYGDKGRNALYSAGKKFGWVYSLLSNFPKISEISEKEMKNFVYQFIRYVEAGSFGKMSHHINLKTKELDIYAENYMVCSYNGLGYLFADGSVSGSWAYLMEDKNVEGVQVECKGRGDKKCHVICAPQNILSEKGIKFLEDDLADIDVSTSILLRYIGINKIRKPQFSRISLKDLINEKIFKYSRGVISYKNERYFIWESHLIYFLEMELNKLNKGENVLFACAFDYAKKLAESRDDKNYEKFIADYMSALGYGDIFIKKDGASFTVFSNYFPWTIFSDKISYAFYRGLLSGLFSGFIRKEIKLEKTECSFSADCFNVKVY